MNRRTKPSPAQMGYKWVGWEMWDWTLFEEFIYKLYMEFQSWSKCLICIQKIWAQTLRSGFGVGFQISLRRGSFMVGDPKKGKQNWFTLVLVFQEFSLISFSSTFKISTSSVFNLNSFSQIYIDFQLAIYFTFVSVFSMYLFSFSCPVDTSLNLYDRLPKSAK